MKIINILLMTLVLTGCALSQPAQSSCDPVKPVFESIKENSDGTVTLTPEQIGAILKYIEALEGCRYA